VQKVSGARGRQRLLAAVGAALVIAGCGTSQTNNSSAEPILLGLTVALSGPNATSAQPTINAFNFGVQQINAKGGVLGRPLKLDMADIGATPAEGLAAVQKLLGDNVTAIVGGVSSAQALTVAADLAKAHTLLFTVSSTQAILFNNLKNPWIFNFHSTNPDNAADIAKFAKDKGFKRVAFLVDDTAFGKTFVSAFTADVLSTNGLSVVASEQLSVKDNDASSQITKIYAAKPDMIIAQMYANESALSLREMHKRGSTLPPIVFTPGALYGAVAGVIPWSELAGTYVQVDNSVFVLQNPPANVAAWVKQVSTDKVRAADNTAQSYDGLLLLANAIQQAGTTDSSKVQAKVSATKNFSGFNGVKTVASNSYTCDEKHECWHGETICYVSGPFDLTILTTYAD
jgi:branched-chain amino acid transport system substrate-binding protein